MSLFTKTAACIIGTPRTKASKTVSKKLRHIIETPIYDIDLVMWVQCINTTFWSRTSTDENEVIFHANNIRFVIARGLDLAERSHGLLGQSFLNKDIAMDRVCGHIISFIVLICTFFRL